MTHIVFRRFGRNSTVRTPEEIADLCQRFQASFAEAKNAKSKCPFCPKLRGEHSEAEVIACVEMLRKKEDERRKKVVERFEKSGY